MGKAEEIDCAESVLAMCDMDSEEDMLQLWSFPNDADEEEWTW